MTNDQSSTNQDSHHIQQNIAPSASIQSTLQSHDKSPPSNSIRQRSSNVASLSPDVEFQKVALDTCRSTIVQQEAEIRKLRETLDLKNKKILQLKGQIESSVSHLASRNQEFSGNIPHSTLQHLLLKLIDLLDKLHVQSPTVNVYNDRHPKATIEHSTQTDRDLISVNTVTNLEETDMDRADGMDLDEDSHLRSNESTLSETL